MHNGIVENYISLREQLLSAGVTLKSDTDSEVIVHLVEQYMAAGYPFKDAVGHTRSTIVESLALPLGSQLENIFGIVETHGLRLSAGQSMHVVRPRTMTES